MFSSHRRNCQMLLRFSLPRALFGHVMVAFSCSYFYFCFPKWIWSRGDCIFTLIWPTFLPIFLFCSLYKNFDPGPERPGFARWHCTSLAFLPFEETHIHIFTHRQAPVSFLFLYISLTSLVRNFLLFKFKFIASQWHFSDFSGCGLLNLPRRYVDTSSNH